MKRISLFEHELSRMRFAPTNLSRIILGRLSPRNLSKSDSKSYKIMSKEFMSTGVATALRCGLLVVLMLQSLREHVFSCLHQQYCQAVGTPMAVTPILQNSLDRHPCNPFRSALPLATERTQESVVKTKRKIYGKFVGHSWSFVFTHKKIFL